MEQKKGLLIIKSSANLSPEQHDQIQQHLDPLGEKTGLNVMIVSDPMDATVYYDPTPMVEALKEATKALNAAADRLNVEHSSLPQPVIARPSPDQGDSYAEFSNPPVRLRR